MPVIWLHIVYYNGNRIQLLFFLCPNYMYSQSLLSYAAFFLPCHLFTKYVLCFFLMSGKRFSSDCSFLKCRLNGRLNGCHWKQKRKTKAFFCDSGYQYFNIIIKNCHHRKHFNRTKHLSLDGYDKHFAVRRETQRLQSLHQHDCYLHVW